MRGYLVSSISAACAAALVLPLSLTAGAATEADPEREIPGTTRSLPLEPLGPSATDRSFGAVVQGLPRRDVAPFSLLGLVWEDAAAELEGTVEVRTRSLADGTWSPWQQVETHNADHAADPGTEESAAGRVRGSTAPLWVGPSDGVEVRVKRADGSSRPLPEGLRLDLVDPGDGPGADPAPAAEDRAGGGGGDGEADGTGPADAEGTDADRDGADGDGTDADGDGTDAGGEADGDGTGTTASGPGTGTASAPAPGTVLPALDRGDTEAAAAAGGTLGFDAAAAQPHIGPRPAIVTRKGWGADESLREKTFVYTSTVKAAFVHHSATGNNYTCQQAPSVLRSIYRYHTVSSGWRDIGYNFAIDKCGNIYEGRAGGVAQPVLGAHTLGFNTNSTGIAVLGTYSSSNPPQAAVTAVARLTAWKLGLHGVDPKGSVTLVSGGSGKYAKGAKVTLNTIAGHRDGFATDCPGGRLYGQLGTIRTASAALQGR
ncbi:peptidoglycan recognition protein [Streptomyces sp. NPDC047968]|uniref:peptidoglycan recognition protein family protein n=1 Tax=unclassified Streptomyces TaxID=2593676 RepID=UPI00343720BC